MAHLDLVLDKDIRAEAVGHLGQAVRTDAIYHVMLRAVLREDGEDSKVAASVSRVANPDDSVGFALGQIGVAHYRVGIVESSFPFHRLAHVKRVPRYLVHRVANVVVELRGEAV